MTGVAAPGNLLMSPAEDTSGAMSEKSTRKVKRARWVAPSLLSPPVKGLETMNRLFGTQQVQATGTPARRRLRRSAQLQPTATPPDTPVCPVAQMVAPPTPVSPATLTVTSGRTRGETVEIPQSAGVWVDLGRADDAAYTLGDDPQLSRHHARLWTLDGCPAIADLDSTNGTRVNGVRISTPVWLRPGDVVRVGTATLEVRSTVRTAENTSTGDEPWGRPVCPHCGTSNPAVSGTDRSESSTRCLHCHTWYGDNRQQRAA
jgi:hypothetical protein